jgi:hypothetical protein
VRSLPERLRAFEQQKARLADAEARLKIAEKKARNRRLMEAGALVEKAGLEGLTPAALYGALLSLQNGVESTKQRDIWTTAGQRAFAQDAKVNNLEPIVIIFPEQPDKVAITNLRSIGFRFNRVLRHWEGMAEVNEAEDIAAEYGGSVTRISYASEADTPS